MNLKNKTNKELWDILKIIDIQESPMIITRYDIHKKIIRREKDNDTKK